MAKKEETKVEKVSAITWAQKVLAKLNLSDAGKIGLFGDNIVTGKQIGRAHV